MGTTIVLADDEPDLRAVYATCLRDAGHEVWEAADGREAIAMVVLAFIALIGLGAAVMLPKTQSSPEADTLDPAVGQRR